MSNSDSTESSDKKILSGLPGPNSGRVSPLHGGPRPKAVERNPFASSDEIEAQRPNANGDVGNEESGAPQAEPAVSDANEAPETPTSVESGGGVEASSPVGNTAKGEPTQPKGPGPTSAFREDPPSSGPKIGLIIVAIIAIAAVAFVALR